MQIELSLEEMRSVRDAAPTEDLRMKMEDYICAANRERKKTIYSLLDREAADLAEHYDIMPNLQDLYDAMTALSVEVSENSQRYLHLKLTMDERMNYSVYVNQTFVEPLRKILNKFLELEELRGI